VQYSHRVWGTLETSKVDKNVFKLNISKVSIGKYLSDSFPVQKWSKSLYRHCFSTLF
jgi:hypothetical protein